MTIYTRLTGGAEPLEKESIGGIRKPYVKERVGVATSFESRAAAAAAVVPTDVTTLRVGGFATAGDGGEGLYVKISTPSPVKLWHFQSADGAWWQLSESVVGGKQLGAVGDGATNDTPAIQGLLDRTEAVRYLPSGDYSTTFTNFQSVTQNFVGEGRITTVAGKLPPIFAYADARPTVTGSYGSLLTYFDGDVTKSPFQVGMNIRNAGTLGTPTSAYLFTPELAVWNAYCRNEAGHNQSTSLDDGRTGYVMIRNYMEHRGQGDALVFNTQGNVYATNPSATTTLACPAVALYGGSLNAWISGVGLAWGESHLNDNGFDVRGVGPNIRFVRTNDTSALYQWWTGLRLTSGGTKDCDHGMQLIGPWKAGLDLTGATFANAAIALKAQQKIEFHAVYDVVPTTSTIRGAATFNQWDMLYDAATTSILVRTGGTLLAQFLAGSLKITGVVNATSAFQRNGTQVVGARATGWTAMTGTLNKGTAYDPATITLVQLAERVNSIQAALTTHGLIGT